MPSDKEHIRKELEALREQVFQLVTELRKEKDQSDKREHIRQQLESISERSLQLIVDLGGKRDEVIREIAENIVKKRQVERFERYHGELAKFLSSEFKVVAGPTQEEMIQQLFQIIKHAEGLWNDATLLFKKKRYATACFLSIVCIEECAKINFGEFQIEFSFVYPKTSSANLPRKSVLTSHEMKHFLAACAGALVNSRMDRVLGMEKVNSFISDCEKGKLEKLRQSCLYVDIKKSGQIVLLPTEQITREQALFYACLAGELLAQVVVGDIGYHTLERLLDKVNKFEKENGISTSKNNTPGV